jgi:CBS domain containing-hemolysin-like protein
MTVLLQTLKEVHCNAPTLGVWVAAALAVLLLFFSGFASASEIAFFSLSPNDLNELDPERDDNDRKIQRLRDDSERTLATILITNNLVNVTIIMLCNYVFASVVDFGNALWLQFICITVILTFLLLLFGEIMPKVYARQNPLKYCRRSAGGIMFLRRLF